MIKTRWYYKIVEGCSIRRFYPGKYPTQAISPYLDQVTQQNIKSQIVHLFSVNKSVLTRVCFFGKSRNKKDITANPTRSRLGSRYFFRLFWNKSLELKMTRVGWIITCLRPFLHKPSMLVLVVDRVLKCTALLTNVTSLSVSIRYRFC